MAARPVFVIGAARSGTNLVRALLSAHPSIELRNEPELILSLTRAGVGPDDVVPREDRARLLLLLSRTGLTREHIAALPPAAIEDFLTARRDPGLKEIYELLLPRPDGEVVWGEKSLGNAYLMREIASLYPDALFVHVLRDPRAATWSWVALHYLDEEDDELRLEGGAVGAVTYSAMRWANWTDAIDSSSEALPDAALTRVRFEELVEDPAAVVRLLCSLLEIDFDEQMLEPEHRGRDPVLDTRREAHRRLAEPVDPARAAAGDALPRWATTVVERYTGDAMERHGYQARWEALSDGEEQELHAELDFIEPILCARLARDLARSGPRPRGDALKSESDEGRPNTKPDSLAALAATAIRRRGIGAESKTEVEALRAFAAAAIDQLEEARAARVRARRRLAAANAKLRALRSESNEGPKRKRKRRGKDTDSARTRSKPSG